MEGVVVLGSAAGEGRVTTVRVRRSVGRKTTFISSDEAAAAFSNDKAASSANF